MGKRKEERYTNKKQKYEQEINTIKKFFALDIEKRKILTLEKYDNREMLQELDKLLNLIEEYAIKYIPHDWLRKENGGIEWKKVWENFNYQLYIDEEEQIPDTYIATFSERVNEYPKRLIESAKSFFDLYDVITTKRDILNAGEVGEEILYNRINIVSDFQLLKNVRLDGGENLLVEHDFVILAPTGVFTVEVKNWKGKCEIDDKGYLVRGRNDKKNNIAEQSMRHVHNLKRFLPGIKVYPIIVWANNESEIKNNFLQIPVCTPNTIEFEIMDNVKYHNDYSQKELMEIKKIIETYNLPLQKFELGVNMTDLKNTFCEFIGGIKYLPDLYKFDEEEINKTAGKVIGTILGVVLAVATGGAILSNDDKK